MRNALCRLFVSLMFGRRASYWIDDAVEEQMAEFAKSNVAGASAAVVLVKAMQGTGFDNGKFNLDGWTVTVSRKETP